MKINNFLTFILLIIFLSQPVIALDAGASSSLVVNSQLLTSEDEIIETAYLKVTNRGDSDVIANFELEGDIADKAVMDVTMKSNETIPAGETQNVEVTFNVKTTGAFEGKIYSYISAAEDTESEGASSQVGIGLITNVLVNVRGEAPKGQVQNITVNDAEINKPLHILTQFENEGNVSAEPLVKAEIFKNNISIDMVQTSDTTIQKGNSGVIDLLWETTGQGTGEYLASVEVLLGKETLATSDHTFSIVETGSLIKEGRLEGISLQNEAIPNEMIKVLSRFTNSGEVAVNAMFVGEVYKGDTMVSIVRSDPVVISPGKTQEIASYVNLGGSGEYTIKGHVNYEGLMTEDKSYSFSAEGASVPMGTTPLLVGCLLAVFVVSLRRRRE